MGVLLLVSDAAGNGNADPEFSQFAIFGGDSKGRLTRMRLGLGEHRESVLSYLQFVAIRKRAL